jgi:hypothetical protein
MPSKRSEEEGGKKISVTTVDKEAISSGNKWQDDKVSTEMAFKQ